MNPIDHRIGLNDQRPGLPESVESARIGPQVGELEAVSGLAGLSESLGLGGFRAAYTGIEA